MIRHRALRTAGSWPVSCLLLSCFAGLVGCGEGSGGGSSGASVQGRVTFAGAPAALGAAEAAGSAGVVAPAGASPVLALSEAEPNDSIDDAQHIGRVFPGARVLLHGHATALDESDPFDGFGWVLPTRSSVRVRLEAASPDADFDVAVFEATSLQVIVAYRTDGTVETGAFVGKGSVLVVVHSVRGASDYDLRLEVDAAPGTQAATGSDDSEPTYLGDVAPGDELLLSGATGDAGGAFLAACPAAVRLLVSSPEVGATFRVSDATEDVTSSDDLYPDVDGSFEIEAGTLVRIDVRVEPPRPEPSRPYVVSLRAAPRPEAATGATGGVSRAPAAHRWLRRGRMARVDAETRLLRGTRVARFGRPRAEFASGSVLVGFEGVLDAEANVALEERGVRAAEALDGSSALSLFDVPHSASDEDRARGTLSRVLALRGAPGVRYAELDRRRHAFATPNDPRYADQWGYPMIRLPEAWDLTQGSSSVVVAVIDTGMTNHPDLAGQQVGGYDFIADPAVAADGGGRDADPTDVGDGGPGVPSSFHGTHVSGTIGAATDNGLGVSGVSWFVELMPLRVLGVGGGVDSDIVQAIRYAARLSNASGTLPAKRADVLNMSLGGGGYSQAMQDAITAARSEGVIVVAAAGNDGTSAPQYPAAYAGVISVVGLARNKTKGSYSNHGSTVDIAAPGGDSSNGILSTIYDDSSGTPVPGYAYYVGTSMACPHVAGVAALVRSVDPSLTPSQVESILTSTAQDLGTAGRDNTYGHGMVDAYAAVRLARDGVLLPVLTLSSSTATFATGTIQRDVAVSNAGGGVLHVDSVTTTTSSGGPWLTAAAYGLGDASTNVDGVRILASEVGLGLGTYQGTVRIASDGGTQDVAVTLVIAQTELVVQLLDSATARPVASAVIGASASFYEVTGVPGGTYRVVAGSDSDGDGVLGEVGDWYGEATGLITVEPGTTVSEVDILLEHR